MRSPSFYSTVGSPHSVCDSVFVIYAEPEFHTRSDTHLSANRLGTSPPRPNIPRRVCPRGKLRLLPTGRPSNQSTNQHLNVYSAPRNVLLLFVRVSLCPLLKPFKMCTMRLCCSLRLPFEIRGLLFPLFIRSCTFDLDMRALG